MRSWCICQFIISTLMIRLNLFATHPCAIDFTDKTVSEDTKNILDEEIRKGRGKYISNCPLLVPATTTSVHNKYLFGVSLSRNACVSREYRKGKAPNTYVELDGKIRNETVFSMGGAFSNHYSKLFSRPGFYLPYTTVYVNMQDYTLREINEKQNIVTLEMTLSMVWMDISLYSYIPKDVTANNLSSPEEGYEISDEAAKILWKPDLSIHHLADYKAFIDSIHTVSLRVKRTNRQDGKVCVSGPMIIHEIEVQISFYCKLDLSNYPLDRSRCKFRIGGKTSQVAFKLIYDSHKQKMDRNKANDYQEVSDIRASFTKVGSDCGNLTKGCIGLNIITERILRPYLLKYYIPCTTIVIMSQISFVIPLEALPGRVALVVTQFLTLTSLFIQQMVSIGQKLIFQFILTISTC